MAKPWVPVVLGRIFIPLLLLLALGIAPRPRVVDQTIKQIQYAVSFGSNLAVAEDLSQVLDYFPGRADLHELAGRYALKGGDAEMAIAHLLEADQQGELSSDGQIALGDAYKETGDLSQAVHAWKEAPGSLCLYQRLEKTHLLRGEYDAAAEDLKDALAFSPNDPQLYYRLGVLTAVTAPEEASTYLKEATQRDPSLAAKLQPLNDGLSLGLVKGDPAYAYLLAGRGVASLDRWDLAAEAFLRAVKMRPDYAEAWAFLSEARQHLSEQPVSLSREGLKELQTALLLDSDSVVVNIFAALYWQRRGDYDQALEYLQDASSLEPDSPELLAEIANTYATMGDLPTALDYYRKAIDIDPKDPMYWRILGEFSLYYQAQIREVGLPAIRQALILGPDDPANLDSMGYAFFLLEDYSNAERFLLRALSLDPGYASARLHLGMNYLMGGEVSSAREQLTLAKTLSPDGNVGERAQRLLARYFP